MIAVDTNVLVRLEGRAQFADHLIGAQAQAFGATTTWTFDRALRSSAGFSILD